MTKLLYQGHASFRLTSNEGKVCYIDPFAGEGYDKEADLVLITHEHYDHNAIDKVKMKDNCVAIRSKDALNQGIYIGLLRRKVSKSRPFPPITLTIQKALASVTSLRLTASRSTTRAILISFQK